MVWCGMVEVCEGAPVAVSGWVLMEWTSLILATRWESVRELDASGVLKMMSVGVVRGRVCRSVACCR